MLGNNYISKIQSVGIVALDEFECYRCHRTINNFLYIKKDLELR